MQFSSYSQFRTRVQQVIDGDDISQSSISVAILDLIIAAGEERIYRDVRSSTMLGSLSLTVAGNLAPLPTDCLELRSVYFAGWPALTYAPLEAIETLLQINTNEVTHPKRFSQQGENLIFYPAQPDGAICLGSYYKRFTDIALGTLNAFFTRVPDLFLYASLAESAPYIGEKDNLPEWKERYLTIAQSANEFERRRVSRGSKLATRVA